MMMAGCTTTIEQKQEEDPFAFDNQKFLEQTTGQEAFRVLITPESYTVVQVNFKGKI